MEIKKLRKQYLPIVISLLSLFLMLYAVKEYSDFNAGLRERGHREKLLKTLISKKTQLEKSLYSRIYYTKSVAAYVTMNTDIPVESFYKLADEFLKGDSIISTMALSKNCVINALYPLPGHESAIGLNLLSHPKRREIVESTIKTQKTFVAGPVELVEGGIAFISYTPIFTNGKGESKNFWGVTDIVIYRDKLFNEAGLTTRDETFIYGLKGEDGKGEEGSFFWGDSTVFKNSPVTVEVSLPTGSWVYAAAPAIGWSGYLEKTESAYFPLYLSAFVISMLIWLLAAAWQKIRRNEREMKALFGSMDELVIEFNRRGEYVKIAPTNEKLLVRPREELTGKNLSDVFNQSETEMFMAAIKECLALRKKVVIDYPLLLGDETRWFQARLSPLTDETVLYVAYDNTEKKLFEDNLVESERKLKELNATKDKFFSIVAHDLRSPFQGFLGITRMFAENDNVLSSEECKAASIAMNQSAQSLFKLLENLLEWARIQRSEIECRLTTTSAYEIAARNVETISYVAVQKAITISNNIPPDIMVAADPQLTDVVFRNLLSNAVKFTPRGGAVKLAADRIDNGIIRFAISDTGIGIAENRSASLFNLGSIERTTGTEGEPSSGLGLILCREFVELQGGKIWVNSTVGMGSTFYFTLAGAAR